MLRAKPGVEDVAGCAYGNEEDEDENEPTPAGHAGSREVLTMSL